MPEGLGISWKSSEDCFLVYFVRIVVEGNYISYLVIVVIFMVFGEAKR